MDENTNTERTDVVQNGKPSPPVTPSVTPSVTPPPIPAEPAKAPQRSATDQQAYDLYTRALKKAEDNGDDKRASDLKDALAELDN